MGSDGKGTDVSAPVLRVEINAGYSKQTILKNVSFELHGGERLGLIGSSGAGKSTLLLALLGLLPWRRGWVKGIVEVGGKNLLGLPEREARKIRGKTVSLVPQSPMTALNSALSIEKHFRAAWSAHQGGAGELNQRVAELMSRVHLPADRAFLSRKPTQISVGQAQRVVLALALLHRPSILVADEPTSALDPVTQSEVLALLREINRAEETALLYISHDLLSVLQLCERVALLHEGVLVEDVSVNDMADAPGHPALCALLQTLPAPVDVLLRHAHIFENESTVETARSSTSLTRAGGTRSETGDLVFADASW